MFMNFLPAVPHLQPTRNRCEPVIGDSELHALRIENDSKKVALTWVHVKSNINTELNHGIQI